MPSQDVWKFTPVSYRTSALWGRCPALTPILQLITPSRASGTADHVRSLDDLFLGAKKHLYNWLCPLVGWSGNAFARRSTRHTILAYMALFSLYSSKELFFTFQTLLSCMSCNVFSFKDYFTSCLAGRKSSVLSSNEFCFDSLRVTFHNFPISCFTSGNMHKFL